jgi:hypothetical protein
VNQDEEKVEGECAIDALFDAGRNERPPHALREQRKLYRRLALGGLAALLFVHVTEGFAGLPRAVRASLATVAMCGLIVSAFVLVHSSSVHDDDRASAPALAKVAQVEAPRELAPAAQTSAVEAPVPDVSVDSLPSAPPTAPSARRELGSSQAREAAAGLDGSLERETRSLAKIRGLVASSDFTDALAAVAEHRATFPGGLLGQEATVLEIEALQGAHDPRGCRVGRAFLDAHPASAHRTRVTTLLRSCGE